MGVVKSTERLNMFGFLCTYLSSFSSRIVNSILGANYVGLRGGNG